MFRTPALEGQALIRTWQKIIALGGLNETLTPLVRRGADAGLESAISRGFVLAIAQFPVYSASQEVYKSGRERMVDGTAPTAWQTEAAQIRVGHCHAFGVMLRIGAFFVLVAVLLLGTFAGQAQAHGFHNRLTVQMPASWAESTVSQDEAEAEGAEASCGVNCCSATGCATAVLNAAHPGIAAVATDSRFALPGQTSTKPSPQSTLKRPPRA